MSTHTTESDGRDAPDDSHLETDVSAGWREEHPALACSTSIEPEHAEAMHRRDRPERYRRKHRDGRSS